MDENKKTIIIVVMVVIIFVMIATIVRINNHKKEEQERINRTISTSGETQERENQIKEKLEKAGLQVTIGDTTYSELLNQNGNIFNIEGIDLEIYQVEESKIAAITNNQMNGLTMIKGENGIEEEALVFENLVILKCVDESMQNKLIKALSTENEENAIESISDVQHE